MSLLAGTAYVDVLPNTDKFGSALQGKLKGIGDSMTSMGKKLSLGLTAPLVAFGTAAVAEASEAAVVAAQTEAALKSSGNAAVLTASQVESVGTAIMNMAAVDDEAAQKTANLLLSMTDLGRYGDQADSVLQSMTETVYNMAAQTGRSEGSFVRLMATVQNTPAKAIPMLQKLGVITQDQADKYKQMVEDGEGAAVSTELLAAAQKRFAGAAKAATTPQQRLKVQLANLSETLGKVLLPYVNKIIKAVQGWIEKFQGLSPSVQKIIVFIGVLLATLGPVLIVLGKVAGAVKNLVGVAGLLGKAFSFIAANPIVLVLIAIAVAAYLIIKNWDKVKAFFIGLWNKLKEIGGAIYDWLTKTIGGVVQWVLDKWKAFVSFFTSLPGKIGDLAKRVGTAILDALKAVPTLLVNGLKAYVDFWIGLPGRILQIFKSIVNGVIGLWNRIDFGIHIKIPSWVPFVGGKGFDINDIFPDIPYLAKGGIVRQPTLAMVGEAGPEAVVPLSRLGGSEAKLTITDWRRGIGTLEYEIDRLGLVRGD